MNLNGIVESIEKASTIKPEPGDYTENGLLHCGKCNTPKQTQIELFGKVRKPLCLCRCATEKRDAEQAAWERQQQLDKVKRLRRMGFPDAEMSRWTFAVDDGENEKISTVAKNYVDNFAEMRKRGKGLLFFGDVGRGKSFIAACIANALIDRGFPCLVTNFARLTNTIGGMYSGKQEYIDGLDQFELLVIDDLASERDTEYMGEMVQNIIDSRYRSGKPLVITTNLTAEELKAPEDMRRQRIFSRLLEMCVPIEVQGYDRRKKKLVEEHREMADLLGL